MKPESRNTPSLPAQRAFVVQFRSEAMLEQDHWHGRVEHVVSGQACQFQSLEELLSFFARVLTSALAQSELKSGK